MTTLAIFQYFVIILAMLGGALSGIYLGLYTILEPQPKKQSQKTVRKISQQETAVPYEAKQSIPTNSATKENPDGDVIRAKMKKQDTHYCFLNQPEHKTDNAMEAETEAEAETEE